MNTIKVITTEPFDQTINVSQEKFARTVNLHSEAINLEIGEFGTICRYMAAKTVSSFLRKKKKESVFGYMPISETELKIINELDKKYLKTGPLEYEGFDTVNIESVDEEISDWGRIIVNTDMSEIDLMKNDRDFFIVYIDGDDVCTVPATQCARFFAGLGVRGLVKSIRFLDTVDDREVQINFKLVESLEDYNKFEYLPIFSIEDCFRWCAESALNDDEIETDNKSENEDDDEDEWI